MTRRTLRRPLLILLSVTIVLVTSAWIAILTQWWIGDGIPFDSARWKSTPATRSDDSRRQKMVDDLLRSHQLIGRPRAEVEALIGPPDDTSYFRAYDMVYLLGPERNSNFAIDSEWLVIKLNSAGSVTEARLVTD